MSTETAAQGPIKMALEKQQCNKIKLLVKKLLMQIDGEKTGQVKSDVFQSILALHNVILSEDSFKKL